MSGVVLESGDGTRLYVEDRGAGAPIVFLAAWTFHSEIWREAMEALSALGYRCVAPDRRGFGRSEVPSTGYDPETLAGDLAVVFERLDLSAATIVAYSMGSFEAARYAAAAGASRIARLVFVSPTTPFLMQTPDNPEGFPREAIEANLAAIAADYPGWVAENEEPFFTPQTPAATRDWLRAMMLSAPLEAALACRRAVATTDSRADLAAIRKPTLVLHGDKDASAPLALTGAKTARLVPGAELRVYEGAPHALPITHAERFIGDLSAFVAT